MRPRKKDLKVLQGRKYVLARVCDIALSIKLRGPETLIPLDN